MVPTLRGIVVVVLVAGLCPAATAEEGYAGEAECLACHEDLQADFAQTIHARTLSETNALTPLMRHGCESCHGPGTAHVEAGGGKGVGVRAFRAENGTAIADENAACLTCHGKGDRLHWAGSPHESRDVACTSCHVVHKNLSERHQLSRRSQTELCGSCHLVQRAQMFRNAHMPVREGAMSCSSCHNAHGGVNEAMLRHDTVNDNCYSCHADKRGPFLWEHAPVSESCLNCHAPHGSTRERMLKISQPRLCQECHTATLHPSVTRSAADHFVLGRSCGQCHTNIHGSNHPSGFVFTR